jgi:hypothetical protein
MKTVHRNGFTSVLTVFGMNSNASDNGHSCHANPYNQQLAQRCKVMPTAVKHKQRLQPDHYSGTVNREELALTE